MASNEPIPPARTSSASGPRPFIEAPLNDSIIPALDPKDSQEELKLETLNTTASHKLTFVPVAPELPSPPATLRPPQTPTRGRISMESLREADQIRRKLFHTATNTHARYSYKDLWRVKGSVIPRVLLPSLALTIWGTLWTCLYMVRQGAQGGSGEVGRWGGREVGRDGGRGEGRLAEGGRGDQGGGEGGGMGGEVKGFVMDTLLITVLGVVMSLLLSYRTNTAYDRYWEGRRSWSTLLTHIRNLSRFIWIGVAPKTEQETNERKGAMNLLLAYAVATKHYLRDEPGYRYKDLRHLVAHLPDLKAKKNIENMPLELSFHIAAYVARCRKADLIDAAMSTSMTNALSGMIDCLSSFERIRNSPIPLAYSIHLKQTLMLYLISLPFQLVSKLYWGTIPVIFLASFTLLGIESIGGEIENPFGYDDNDLPVEKFCEDTREELNSVMHRESKIDPDNWGKAVMVSGTLGRPEVVIHVDGGVRQRKGDGKGTVGGGDAVGTGNAAAGGVGGGGD
ncbi:hypothetical protein HDV00_009306 [Rhizophlyctis rosea]|nr:hypothetical protein HDV00_009306 [Rhizophlyctis rosea]